MWRILMCGLLCASTTLCAQNEKEVATDHSLLTALINDKPIVIDNKTLIVTNITQEKTRDDEPTIPNRSGVTYDQRQEGQYNIRADLENFMIMIIPQNPSEGLNILDILTKSASKGFQYLKPNVNKQLELKFRPQGEPNKEQFSFINKQPSISLLNGKKEKISDLIEGRNPYKVDLSSKNYFSQTHTNEPVDVLPPPYPLAYQLLKPYHLDAEPNIVQAVKHPQSFSNPDKIIKAIKLNYNLNDNLNNFRISKTLSDKSYIDYSHDGFDDVLGKTKILEMAYGNSEESKEETLDSNFLNNSTDNIDEDPSWEMKLIGSTENCGPGARRDSYGICRFMSSY
ncbi:hypothetical protein ACFFRR_005358 [Megaselia abdita]